MKTLRDEMAMAYLAGRVAGRCDDEFVGSDIAKECYQVADAMLLERVKKGGDQDEGQEKGRQEASMPTREELIG